MLLMFFYVHQPLDISMPDPNMWTRGGGVTVPCGPNGHVDPEKKDDEIGLIMCEGV